jgi:hypothetical protein
MRTTHTWPRSLPEKNQSHDTIPSEAREMHNVHARRIFIRFYLMNINGNCLLARPVLTTQNSDPDAMAWMILESRFSLCRPAGMNAIAFSEDRLPSSVTTST